MLGVTDPANIVKIGSFRLRPEISIHNMVLVGKKLSVWTSPTPPSPPIDREQDDVRLRRLRHAGRLDVRAELPRQLGK
ncbi:hypothetical protein [Archangium lansingense]|uniref:Uncharacterized protein n=1 Tax=Archangium lansingense TaxID=2995310 RepID=A0ABT4A0D4_9BACT|nr:hypothetical protein [Archangium lansinium]MCY1075102.1 hypothetical protein [Archangium lansinium]